MGLFEDKYYLDKLCLSYDLTGANRFEQLIIYVSINNIDKPLYVSEDTIKQYIESASAAHLLYKIVHANMVSWSNPKLVVCDKLKLGISQYNKEHSTIVIEGVIYRVTYMKPFMCMQNVNDIEDIYVVRLAALEASYFGFERVETFDVNFAADSIPNDTTWLRLMAANATPANNTLALAGLDSTILHLYMLATTQRATVEGTDNIIMISYNDTIYSIQTFDVSSDDATISLLTDISMGINYTDVQLAWFGNDLIFFANEKPIIYLTADLALKFFSFNCMKGNSAYAVAHNGALANDPILLGNIFQGIDEEFKFVGHNEYFSNGTCAETLAAKRRVYNVAYSMIDDVVYSVVYSHNKVIDCFKNK